MEEVKILLVEDEKKIANTLRKGLEEHGYWADVAYEGQSGWQQFNKVKYQLAVLDINLPNISGYQLCRMMREKNGELPIIMLTALGAIGNKEKGYDAGADDYIVKPFEFRELLLKIRALLRRSLPHVHDAGVVLKAADLEMNIESKQVTRGNRWIQLTVKEFQLLEYLLRNKNKILSRADIARNVWDIDFDTNTNVIDVYINYVRKKVDKPFEQKLIQTQVGMGYILKENA